MSSSYLPEKVFAVCTHNLDGGYGKLLKDPDVRTKYTVLFKSKDKPLLTMADKKLDGQFACKTNWSSGIGTAAFGGGIMVGLAIAATVVAIPFAGWVVGGLIALGCLAWGLISFFSKPSCSDMIGYQESFWTNEHSSVAFDGFYAVTKQSMIVCKEGGMLLPFMNEAAAAEAASEIASTNRWQVGAEIGASFLAGVLSGWAAGSVGGAAVGTGRFAGTKAASKEILEFTAYGMAFGIPIGMALSKETGLLREHYGSGNGDNPIYDTITGEKVEDTDINPFSSDFPFIDPFPVPNKPTKEVLLNHTDVEADDITDPWNPKGLTDKFKGINRGLKERREAIKGIAGSQGEIARLNAQIAAIDRALAEAKKINPKTGKPIGLAQKNNPYAKIIFQQARSGAYGPEVKNFFTNASGKGKNNPNSYKNTRENATTTLDEKNSDSEKQQKEKSKGLNRVFANAGLGLFGNIPALSVPFVSTWLSEKTFKAAADAAMADMANGISIVAQDH
ncbi:hypothetical protein [Sinomicrobium sp. M5D2P17]